MPDVVLRHDFVDSWAKFRRKFSHYAQMDDQLARLDPGLGPFLEEYFAESRPQRSYTLDEGQRAELRELAWSIVRVQPWRLRAYGNLARSLRRATRT